MKISYLRYFLCALFMLLSSLFAADTELVVHLNLSQPKVPIYLGPLLGTTKFEPSYLSQLKNVFIFDLDQTCKLHLITEQDSKDKLFKDADFKKAFASPIWKNEHITYILLPKIEESNLSLMVYHVDFNHVQHYKNISLTGDLSLDRRQLHKLSDSIHQYLFNLPGIATTKILYTLQLPHPNPKEHPYQSEIWECDYDGSNQRKLTPSDKYCITPVFFPSKDKLSPSQFLYVSYEKGPSKIFISSFATLSSHPFIDLKGNQLLPALSRDRSKIAFISDASGRADLFLQAIHPERGLLGKPIQVFSYPASVQASPTFSPDGKQLAFVSDKEGSPRIYLIDTPHVSKALKLPKAYCISLKNSENTCPNWSPDGRKLAYSAKTEGIRQIWVYDFESKEEKQLTKGSEHKENPCWAPDSQHLVFNTAGHTSEIYIMSLLEPNMVKISSGPGKKHFPAWQP